MTVRVGVTGHREGALDAADNPSLREAIDGALQAIKQQVMALHEQVNQLYAPVQPELRIVSALAEGADRLVALAAIALGFALECPLPFARSDYELDFSGGESTESFRRLLNMACSVCELDGRRGTSDERASAYQAAGRTMLRHSDVVLAIWDGKAARGVGGTAQVVAEALAMNLPVLWIKPASPCAPVLLDPTGAKHPLEQLAYHLRSRLLPSGNSGTAAGIAPLGAVDSERDQHPSDQAEADAAKRYFAERWPRGKSMMIYDVFVRLLSWPARPSPAHDPEGDDVWGELSRSSPQVWRQISESFEPHSSWADALATHYAGRYRSSTVSLYLMGAVAVLTAFLGIVTHHRWPFLVELCVILIIIALTFWGRRQGWHERWIDYRVLAEELRQMRLLALLARVTSTFQVPAHLAHHEPGQSWFTWHFRTIARQAGLVGMLVDAAYLKACEQALIKLIRSQIRYHTQRSLDLGHLRRRLHRIAACLFVVAGLACIPHWWVWPREGLRVDILSLAGLVLPAFAGALVAIASQGELERIEVRSRALRGYLIALLARRQRSAREASTLSELGQEAQEFADILLAELVDWRFVFLGKPIELPA